MNRLSLPIIILLLTLNIFNSTNLFAEDGYRLWLRYNKVENKELLDSYRSVLNRIVLKGNSKTSDAIRNELTLGLGGLLDRSVKFADNSGENTLIISTPQNSEIVSSHVEKEKFEELGDEGFYIYKPNDEGKSLVIITANTDLGLLYGTFHFLQLLQSNKSIEKLEITSAPNLQHRLLNHWDDLDGHVERGYAGSSLWDWHTLPLYISQRYIDYARANASVGINGTAITNVNSNALILTPEYLEKVKALADAFRPYGIKIYLTARFSAPIEIGGLKTADPMDENVIGWWNMKVKEIYSYIPDFGGFLVKANSEGQPGPHDYNRTHAEGANMLARPLQKFGGIVMWRAFVYSNEEPEDRAKQAYNEFMPLDGKFEPNVMVQSKNGAIDFQPREPFHPLFGAMKNTPIMMEFQITQEYLGQGTHLTYLAPLYREVLDADTYAKGEGSEVWKAIDGSLYNNTTTGMAGVSNIGDDINWCGHPIAQSNWYAYGKFAWNMADNSEDIAKEWIRLTFSKDEEVISTLLEIMMESREAGVNYRTPIGLHHQMAWHHHYGPGPWIKNKPRADWTSAYYNKADKEGLGFDRTKTGSDAVSQYFSPLNEEFANIETCPEEFLLWFHHVPWDYKMKSGRSMWEEFCFKYYAGTDAVKDMQVKWDKLEGKIDAERFQHVQSLLKIQMQDAIEWRNACLLYFQTFSEMPIPDKYEQPNKTLEEYMQVNRKFLPGS